MDIQLSENNLFVLRSYNKTLEDVRKLYEETVAWGKTQPHLPELKMTEGIYRGFIYILVACKFNMEKVRESIDTYARIKTTIPEFFRYWDPLCPEMQNIMRVGGFLILPKLTPDFKKVVVCRLLNNDPDEFDPYVAMTMAMMFSEVHGRKYLNLGEHYILDATGAKASYAVKFPPSLIKNWYTTISKAYVLRFCGAHILNASPPVNLGLNIVKPFVKTKIYQRIHIHPDLESLHKIIPKEILPKDYGGLEPSFDEMYAKQIKELEEARTELMEELKYKSDESKRIKNLEDDTFGCKHGSFKQLGLD